MEKKRFFIKITKIILVAPLLFVSACKEEAIVTSQPTISNEANTSSPSTKSLSNDLPSNLKVEPDSEAEKVPKLFYQSVTEGKYDQAADLLGTQLQFRGNANLLPYIKNIKKVTFLELRDISSDPDAPSLIGSYYKALHPERYYQIKIYYSVLDIEIADTHLQPALPGTNYRIMILLKETPNSPWVLDTDANTAKRK